MDAPLARLLVADLTQDIAILWAGGSWGGRRPSMAGDVTLTATNQQRWEHGAADGFDVMPPGLPAGLEAFVDRAVPILQRRGLFRTEHAGKTLRENYGLPRPPNRNHERALEGPA